MAAPRPFTVSASCSEEHMFAAALTVAQTEGYSIQGVCNEGHEALFLSPDTESDAGRIVVVSVVAGEGGTGSVLQATVGEQKGTSWSWSNGKKIQAVGERFTASVRGLAESDVVPTPERVASFARREDGTVVPWNPGDEPWE